MEEKAVNQWTNRLFINGIVMNKPLVIDHGKTYVYFTLTQPFGDDTRQTFLCIAHYKSAEALRKVKKQCIVKLNGAMRRRKNGKVAIEVYELEVEDILEREFDTSSYEKNDKHGLVGE